MREFERGQPVWVAVGETVPLMPGLVIVKTETVPGRPETYRYNVAVAASRIMVGLCPDVLSPREQLPLPGKLPEPAEETAGCRGMVTGVALGAFLFALFLLAVIYSAWGTK